MPPTPDPADADLDAALDRVWRVLGDAVGDRNAGLHQPVIATAGADARIMVLRGIDRAAHSLRFHTDGRAAKAVVIAASPQVAVVGYDATVRLQLRLYGLASLATDTPAVAAAWSATSAFGRRAYQTTAPPGTYLAAPGTGLADDPAAVDEGRANFAVLTVELDRIEWLRLAHSGHRRAVHHRVGDRWIGDWRVP